MSTNHHHLTINNFVIPYLNLWIFIQAFMTVSFFLVISIWNITKISHPVMWSFMNSENFINIVKGNIFFKGKGSCIDVILTNRRYSFRHISSSETCLSDHHHLISSMMKRAFEKEESKILINREYNNFNIKSFK